MLCEFRYVLFDKAEFNKVINIEKKDLWQDKILVVWSWIWVLPTGDGSDDGSIQKAYLAMMKETLVMMTIHNPQSPIKTFASVLLLEL